MFSLDSYAQINQITYDGVVHQYSGREFSLKIDGKTVNSDVPPVIINNYCYIPVRAAFEKLGGILNWDSTTRKMTINYKGKILVFRDSNNYVKINDKMIKMDTVAKLINYRLMIPLSFFKKQLGMAAVLRNENLTVTIDNLNVLSGVKYAKRDGNDFITLNINNYKDYSIMRLTGPDRIVIDIPSVAVPEGYKKMDVNSFAIKSIRYSQFDNNSARIVLDVLNQSEYEVKEEAGHFNLLIKAPSYKNIRYYNNYDRRGFILNSAQLTEGGEFLTKYYKGIYDETGKKYTVSFPDKLADLDDCLIEINDNLFESVQIINDNVTNLTKIIFSAKDRFVYEIISRPDSCNTAITVLKPAAPGERLIVIDPGHGGSETGAVYGDIYEKNLNLDISLKLNALLKAKNIKTYMIREDDSFVGLYERGYIANDLNASLFMSVHINAMDDPGYSGTMTLYYPQNTKSGSFSGKRLATIIQGELLKKLNTVNRNIIERPNLIVLKASTMPAAIAEIAFLTNKADRANLLSGTFRQKAAQALYDAAIQSLNEMDR